MDSLNGLMWYLMWHLCVNYTSGLVNSVAITVEKGHTQLIISI